MKTCSLYAVIIWSLILIVSQSCTEKQIGIKDDEYAIYQEVIDTLYVNTSIYMNEDVQYKDIVLFERTGLQLSDSKTKLEAAESQRQDFPSFDDVIKSSSKDWKNIESNYMMSNFEKTNSDSYPLAINRLGSLYNYRTLTRETFGNYFNNGINEGWGKFYKDYPQSFGVLSFSRAAFNKNKDAALVYFEHYKDSLEASGNFVFLVKLNDRWTIMEVVTNWAS